jgi:hypothetical protein
MEEMLRERRPADRRLAVRHPTTSRSSTTSTRRCARTSCSSATDYIVKDGKVVIIDEFTGRMMEGRRYSEGLHQALEAKEGVQDPAREPDAGLDHLPELFPPVRQARRHDRHGHDRSDEFGDIYKLEVVEIPTNVPVRASMTTTRSIAPPRKTKAIIERHRRNAAAASRCWSARCRSRSPKLLSELLKQREDQPPGAERALPRAGSLHHRAGRHARAPSRSPPTWPAAAPTSSSAATPTCASARKASRAAS